MKDSSIADSLPSNASYYPSLRGGQLTFHGPGQIVGYPILDLRDFKMSVRCYVANLENTIIDVCKKFNIQAKSTNDTGVWVTDYRKIAAIGIHVQRHITSHGFALNCNTDLSWFDKISPCGFTKETGKSVTSISKECSKIITVEDVYPEVLHSFGNIFNVNLMELKEFNPDLNEKVLKISNKK